LEVFCHSPKVLARKIEKLRRKNGSYGGKVRKKKFTHRLGSSTPSRNRRRTSVEQARLKNPSRKEREKNQRENRNSAEVFHMFPLRVALEELHLSRWRSIGTEGDRIQGEKKKREKDEPFEETII